jgi:hypothetical protein
MAVIAPGRERVQGRLMRSLVEQVRPGAHLRAADRDGLAVDDLRDLRFRVVQVTVAVSSETPAVPTCWLVLRVNSV